MGEFTSYKNIKLRIKAYLKKDILMEKESHISRTVLTIRPIFRKDKPMEKGFLLTPRVLFILEILNRGFSKALVL